MRCSRRRKAALSLGVRWNSPKKFPDVYVRTDPVMSYSISTLLTRNLHDVFGENDSARRRAAVDEIFTEDCVFVRAQEGRLRGRAAPRSIASRARSRLLTRTFDISQLPRLRIAAMAGGSNGYRALLVRRQLTPGLISSLSRTAPVCRRLSCFFDKLP